MKAEWIVGASYLIGIIGTLGIVFSFFRYSNYKETVKLQNDNIKALEQTVKRLEESQTVNLKAISHLEGQVATYKELPLRELADGINKVSKSNDAILSVLKNSALIAAEDKATLVTKRTTETKVTQGGK